MTTARVVDSKVKTNATSRKVSAYASVITVKRYSIIRKEGKMDAKIETIAMNHNGVCFYTGEKVGKPAGVALITQDGKNLVTMPVSKLYMRYLSSGDTRDFSEWNEERIKKAAETAAKRAKTQGK